MDDLRAEIRELHGFVIGEGVDDGGIRNPSRVGRQHAIYVRPDLDLLGVQQGAENGSREVAPVATECGLHPATVGRNETGDDESALVVRGHQLAHLRPRLFPLDSGSQRTPLPDDDLARIDPLKWASATQTLFHEAVEQLRRAVNTQTI